MKRFLLSTIVDSATWILCSKNTHWCIFFLFQPIIHYESASVFNTAKNASWGTSTLPIFFIRFFPSFCFSNSFLFLVISPPSNIQCSCEYQTITLCSYILSVCLNSFPCYHFGPNSCLNGNCKLLSDTSKDDVILLTDQLYLSAYQLDFFHMFQLLIYELASTKGPLPQLLSINHVPGFPFSMMDNFWRSVSLYGASSYSNLTEDVTKDNWVRCISRSQLLQFIVKISYQLSQG